MPPVIEETLLDPLQHNTLTRGDLPPAPPQATNQLESLDQNQGITVFAPVNSAFEAALRQLNLTTDELLTQKELLTNLQLYHAVEAVFRAADLVDGLILPTPIGQVRPHPPANLRGGQPRRQPMQRHWRHRGRSLTVI